MVIAAYATTDDDAKRRLYELLVQAAGGRWDAPRIGRYLSQNRDRPVDGLVLRAIMIGKVNSWLVAIEATASEHRHQPDPEGLDLADDHQKEIPF